MSASIARATVRAVSRRKILPTRAALTLTPSAVNKVKQLLQHKPEYVNRNVIDVNVCSSGVRVFIEKKAQLTLLGTEMDFVETKLSSEFVFNNPNIKGTCGCGESFSI
ncbi:iron-sulfur cluster assembly 1 homolog, mitochondrial-like [Sinocyclocheilus rhinocerous]|uniref:iron-sulfur cluster assembly 1 homolog, mitochondrial-like n=1 Tax=Sinocyclocheilus rhinocerous TaxID=307959 RepID=UPI0007B86589|nr:PREDICTED: iron-sulfur cluster assembly 1 homolog, mitochondrial-like [Sinocyclocheilus rhinocerous]